MNVNFDEAFGEQRNSRYQGPRVSYFGLKDGERAIVRILVDSTKDIEVVTAHPNLIIGNYRFQRVNCLRSATDDLSKCPLCNRGFKVEQRAYFKIIQYTLQADGSVLAEAKIWNRALRSAFTTSIISYLKDYGKLSDMICAISRTGKSIDDTVYTISPNLSKQVYPDEIYVKNVSLFDGYSVVGGVVRDWSYNEISDYIDKLTDNPAPSNASNATSSNLEAKAVPDQAIPSINHTSNVEGASIEDTCEECNITPNSIPEVRIERKSITPDDSIPFNTNTFNTASTSNSGLQRPSRFYSI